MTYNTDKFVNSLAAMNIKLDDSQINQFIRYYELLVEWNSFMNLTSITEYDEVIEKHFVDSLSLVNVYPNLKSESLLDLGTGAGFPGIPLKIAFPSLNITLMDSLNKRINFLNAVIDELGLTGITAIHGRAEEMARNASHRQHYDMCVSRAVANLSTLSEYCLPFVKIGGCFISYKSGDSNEEIENAKKAVSLLGGKMEKQINFNLPDSDITRSLILIRKTKGTPKAYPRKAGTPSKQPL